MNYQKVYNDIISKAQSENRKKLKKTNSAYVYYECHHILPRCLSGTNDPENLVLLTAKEHFICHKLLTYIYPNNRKISYAYIRMCYSKNGNYNKTLKDYEYARYLLSNIPVSLETKLKQHKAALGVKKTLEHRKHISEGKLGYSPSEESKEKNRKAHIGKKYSKEINLKKGKKGEKHNLWGKHHKEESKEKNRQKHLGNTYSLGHITSEETKLLISNKIKNLPKYECPFCHKMVKNSEMVQYHGNKCKLNPSNINTM